MRTILRARALAFDMDGTLIDSRPAIEALWLGWAKRRNLDGQAILHTAHGRPGVATVAEFEPRVDAAAEWDGLMRQAAEMREGIAPIRGARAMLERLPADRWALVTASERALATRWLAVAGLPFPPLFIGAEDVSAGKPDPEGFLRAARRMGVAPAELLVFEDSLNGARAARAAGARLVAINAPQEARRIADAAADDFESVAIDFVEGALVVCVG
ncbi:MAG: HAD-IA family hydrolase [Rhizobiales bacterium]|nr:HAD-IA family hydrolase [Hyphomicrobiales bacterium]